MKKLICLLLGVMLAVSSAACSKQTKKEDTSANKQESSSYNISTIKKPEGIDLVDFLCYQKGGALRIGGTDLKGKNKSVWDSQDNGKTWKCTVKSDAMPKLAEPSDPNVPFSYKYSSDGKLYACDETKVSMDGDSDKSINIQEAAGAYLDSALAGNSLSMLIQDKQSGEKTLWLYNVDTQKGKQIKNKTLSKYWRKAQGPGCLASDASGKVLYTEGDGIVKYDTARDKVSVLLDKSNWNQYIDDAEEPITGLAVDEKKGIVLRTVNIQKGDSNLYLFTKGKPGAKGTAGKGKSIEIYSLEKEPSIIQSLTFFREKHPDISIEYTVGYTGDDGVTMDDAVRNLNTEILAGKGPDILILDNLPVKQYIEKGVLEDVSSAMDGEKDGLFYNIIKNSNPKDKIYEVPTRFEIPVILGSSNVTSAGSTDAMVRQMEADKGTAPAISERDFPAAGLNLFITSGLVKDGLDAGALTKFFKNLEELKKLGHVKRPTKPGGKSPMDSADVFAYTEGMPGQDLYNGKGKVGISSEEAGMYMEIHSAAKQMNLTFDYLNKKGGNYYIPSEIFGINSKSKQKEAAEDYLKMFLTEKVQNLENGRFSVNRNSTRKQFKITDSPQYYTSEYENRESTTGFDISTMTEDEYGQFVQFAEKADTPVINDKVIVDTVMEQAAKYLFEGKALKDAVNTACDKVNLYLKE